jgi:hypothetical protein
MRTLASLTFRQHRFEIIALVALFALITVGCVAVIVIWSSLPIAECMALTEMTARCYQAQETIQAVGTIGMPLMLAAVAGPAVAGVILGAGLVSKEIERGTAVLPWTMGRSRRRWLLERVLVITVLVGAMGLVLAVITDTIALLFNPTPLDQSLYLYEARGWMVPERGMLGLAAGVLGGAVMGRAVPALLTGAAITVLCCVGVYGVGNELNMAQAVEYEGPGGLYLSDILRDHTGAVVTWEEAYTRIPVTDDASWQLFEAEFTSTAIGVPGSESRIVVGREVAMLGGLAVLLVAGSVVVVERRRPY